MVPVLSGQLTPPRDSVTLHDVMVSSQVCTSRLCSVVVLAFLGLTAIGCKKKPASCEQALTIVRSYADEANAVTRETRNWSTASENAARLEAWIARQHEVLRELDALESDDGGPPIEALRAAIANLIPVYEALLERFRATAAENEGIADVEQRRNDAEKQLRAACEKRSDCATVLAELQRIDDLPDEPSVEQVLRVSRDVSEQLASLEHPDRGVQLQARSFAQAQLEWSNLVETHLSGESSSPNQPAPEETARHADLEKRLRAAVAELQKACG